MLGLLDKTYTLKAIDWVFGLQTKDPAMGSFQCYDLGLFEMWFVDSMASSGSLLEMRNHALSFTHRLERLWGHWEIVNLKRFKTAKSKLH